MTKVWNFLGFYQWSPYISQQNFNDLGEIWKFDPNVTNGTCYWWNEPYVETKAEKTIDKKKGKPSKARNFYLQLK